MDTLGIVFKIFSRNLTINCSLEMHIASGVQLSVGFEAVYSYKGAQRPQINLIISASTEHSQGCCDARRSFRE